MGKKLVKNDRFPNGKVNVLTPREDAQMIYKYWYLIRGWAKERQSV